jgi:hypothetical protein
VPHLFVDSTKNKELTVNDKEKLSLLVQLKEDCVFVTIDLVFSNIAIVVFMNYLT